MRWVINGYLFLIISLLILFYFVLQFPDKFELLIVVNLAIITPYLYLITFKGLTQPTLWQLKAGGQKGNMEKEILQAKQMEALNKEETKIQKRAPGQ